MKNSEVLLGISPGTQTIGLAVLARSELTLAKVKRLYGKWTQRKLKLILSSIEHEILEHSITAIVLKLPDNDKSSPSLNRLVIAIKEKATERQIKIYTYSLKDMKRIFLKGKRGTMKDVMKMVVSQYPELTEEYRKEERNRNAYYRKMFEAVGLLFCLHRQNIPSYSVKK